LAVTLGYNVVKGGKLLATLCEDRSEFSKLAVTL
jgi:hypothetical protein